jgi:hypothetical protein
MERPIPLGVSVGDSKAREFELGKTDTVVCHISDDAKRLLIDFHVDKKGLTKTGVNGLIDALKSVRKKMVRS